MLYDDVIGAAMVLIISVWVIYLYHKAAERLDFVVEIIKSKLSDKIKVQSLKEYFDVDDATR